ncbi:hypothetical protein MKX03_030876 [Papaver bracteatum]|nr:hypothetical protein MKX03_030876 [Papaver bracteatum]
MSSSTCPTQQLAAVGGIETTSDHRSMKIQKLEINSKGMDDGKKKLMKLLLNVTIERSLGPVQVITSSEKSVEELFKSALEIYVKEKRRPLLIETNPSYFELHCSQFCLEKKKIKCNIVINLYLNKKIIVFGKLQPNTVWTSSIVGTQKSSSFFLKSHLQIPFSNSCSLHSNLIKVLQHT